MASARFPRAEVIELVVLILRQLTRRVVTLAEQGPQSQVDGLAGVSQPVPTDDLLDQIAVNLDLDLLPRVLLSTHCGAAEPADLGTLGAHASGTGHSVVPCQIRQRTGCTSDNCSPVAISPLAT